MRRLTFALAVCAFGVAAGGSQAASPPPVRFEAAVVPGSPVATTGFFRINVSTGQTVQAWGVSTQFSVVVDPAPLPTGEYHLLVSATPAVDGKVSWSANRVDALSGRSWFASGGGSAPLVWNEILPPK